MARNTRSAAKLAKEKLQQLGEDETKDEDSPDPDPVKQQSRSKKVARKPVVKKVTRKSASAVVRLEDSSDSDPEHSDHEDFVNQKPRISNNDAPSYQSMRSSENAHTLGQLIPGSSKATEPVASSSKSAKPKKVKEPSVLELLAIGENLKINNNQKRNATVTATATRGGGVPSTTENNNGDSGSSGSSSDESDWEEVQPEDVNTNRPSFPVNGLMITIKPPIPAKRNAKSDYQDMVRIRINRLTRDLQVYYHKVSLLCCLARGGMINDILRDEELIKRILSIQKKMLPAPKFPCLPWLIKTLHSFRKFYDLKIFDTDCDSIEYKKLRLSDDMETRELDIDTQVYAFILLLRALSVDARLMVSLQPMNLKPSAEDIITKAKPKNNESDTEDGKPEQTSETKSKSQKKKKSEKDTDGTSSDSEDEASSKNKKKKQQKRKYNFKKPVAKELYLGRDEWVEVFLSEEGRWVAVDVKKGNVFCEMEIEKEATSPIRYVVAYDNKGHVKDMTRKYASGWLTTTQKERVDSSWWEKSLKPYRGPRTKRDEEEDDFLDRSLLSTSVPQKMRILKGHPLFVVERHLLKFEALYPPDIAPVGYCLKEPVYRRESVHLLHTREVWNRQAKVVRLNETPYKLVKSRPKYNKQTRQMVIQEKPTELFGPWQVEDFVPPVAQDGKVPRNAYGNVELFKPTMLPKGCVHLQLPGLNRVARKLDIDCASAVVDFEFSAGGSHPTFDGFVVCEEFVEVLVDAWNQDQDEREKKAEEKRKARVYGNWKKLIRGVLIRERLNKKYGTGPASTSSGKAKSGKRKTDSDPEPGSSKATKKHKN